MSTPDPFRQRFRLQWVVTAVALSLVLLYLAQLKGMFEKRLVLAFQTDSAVHLFEGMKVTYKGFEVGKLTQLSLAPNGQVQGEVQIREQHKGFFSKGSVLRLSKEKIVTAELVLQRDDTQSAAMDPGEHIAIVREDLAADLTKRLDPLLEKLQLLLTQMADPHDGVQASIKESRQVMLQTSETLKHTTHAMKEIGDEERGLPAVLGKTRDTMQALEPTAQQATRTLKELENSLVQTRKTLDNADKLIHNVDQTVQEVHSAPVYRWLVPKKSPEPATKP